MSWPFEAFVRRHRACARCCVHYRVPVPPPERDPLVTHSARGLVCHGSGVFSPCNALTWRYFESLLADTHLQLDADPESVVSQLSLCQSRAILALKAGTDFRPPCKIYPVGYQQITGLNPSHMKLFQQQLFILTLGMKSSSSLRKTISISEVGHTGISVSDATYFNLTVDLILYDFTVPQLRLYFPARLYFPQGYIRIPQGHLFRKAIYPERLYIPRGYLSRFRCPFTIVFSFTVSMGGSKTLHIRLCIQLMSILITSAMSR